MLKKIATTQPGFTGLILRLTLSVVIFPHGAQKVFGWFGGAGFSGTIEHFGNNWGIPAWLTVLVMLAEFFGSLCLFLGLLGRLMAFSILCVMVGAISIGYEEIRFFMNWQGQQEGEGIEFHILAIGIAMAIIIYGSGRYSIDRLITTKR